MRLDAPILSTLLGTVLAAGPAEAVELAPSPDGALEIRDGGAVAARIALKTSPLRRGAPTLRETEVDGHRVTEVRVPVRGSAAQEVWIAERGPGAAAPRVIWHALIGPRDADEEVATFVEVTPDHVLEYQTAADVTRCDGAPARLFPRAFDFETRRFRPVLAAIPAAPVQRLVARRGDPAMPAFPARPIGDFRWTGASTTAAAGGDARALTAPAPLNDGDPATAWTEGLGGDGRGEFLTARSSGRYAIRGLRIFPGDGSTAQAFRSRNRVRRFQLALGPAPEQRFDVELPEDPAADAARWREPYWVALPRPTAASCVTVVLTEVAPGGEASPPRSYGTTAIGDLSIFTELDVPEGAEHLVADFARAADCHARIPTVVALGDKAVLPAAQAVLSSRGPQRECLVEALAALEPEPKSAIVVEALVAAIAGATEREERLIAATLKRAASPPVGALEQLLSAGGSPLGDRARAARVLGVLADERAPAVLLGAAGQGSPELRGEVALALAASPALRAEALFAAVARARAEAPTREADLLRVLPALVRRTPERRAEALAILHAAVAADHAFEVRGRAIMALGALTAGDGAESVAILAELRSGSDDAVLRYLATRELSAAGSDEAGRALLGALGDHDPRVREAAALGLGRRGEATAGAPLIAGAKQEPWPFVRRAELEALGHLCVAGTGDLMIRASERDVDEVRRAALVTLMRCKDPRGKTILLHALGRRNEPATLRELAAALLGELGDRSVAPELAAALRRLVNESEADIALEGVVAAVLHALGRIGGPEAVAAAVTLAKDARHPFRQPAIEVLGALCDPGAGAATLRALEAGSEPSLAVAAQVAARRCHAHAP